MTVSFIKPASLPSLRVFSSSATRALSNNLNYRVASADLINPGDSPSILGFKSLSPVDLAETQKQELEFLHELSPQIDEIKEYLIFLRETLDDIDNPRGIKTIVREDILNGMSEEMKKHAEDFFFLLGVEGKRNPCLCLDSDLAFLISQTIADIRREFRSSYLGVNVKLND